MAIRFALSGPGAAAPEKDFHAGRVVSFLPLQHIVTPRAEFTTIGQVDGLYPVRAEALSFSSNLLLVPLFVAVPSSSSLPNRVRPFPRSSFELTRAAYATAREYSYSVHRRNARRFRPAAVKLFKVHACNAVRTTPGPRGRFLRCVREHFVDDEYGR